MRVTVTSWQVVVEEVGHGGPGGQEADAGHGGVEAEEGPHHHLEVVLGGGGRQLGGVQLEAEVPGVGRQGEHQRAALQQSWLQKKRAQQTGNGNVVAWTLKPLLWSNADKLNISEYSSAHK